MDNSQRFLIAGETGNRNYELFCLNKAFFYQTNTEITDKILHFDFSNSQQQISVKKQLLLFTRFF